MQRHKGAKGLLVLVFLVLLFLVGEHKVRPYDGSWFLVLVPLFFVLLFGSAVLRFCSSRLRKHTWRSTGMQKDQRCFTA